jgi:ATP-dependent RNA helicase DDX24/MAK5
MRKNNKKRKQPPSSSSSSWQPVQVGLAEPSSKGNHYDKKDSDDDHDNDNEPQHEDDDDGTEMMEDPSAGGIFFGLEVLTNYKIEGGVFRAATTTTTTTTLASSEQEDASKKKKMKKKEQDQKKKIKKIKKKKASAPSDDHKTSPSSSATLPLAAVAQDDDKNVEQTEESPAVTKKSKKQKESKSVDETPAVAAVTTSTPEQRAATAAATDQSATQLQETWSSATGVQLPFILCRTMIDQYPSPTPIQTAVLSPAIFGRRNILGAAPTGSGKTLAFLLPVLYDIITTTAMSADDDDEDEPSHQTPRQQQGIHTLIVTPTRELAKQIYAVAKSLTANMTTTTSTRTKISVACLTGGLAKVKQERVLSHHPHIVTGTPGRLWEMMSGNNIDQPMDLSQLKFFILDEADRLVVQNHDRAFPELKMIFGKLQQQQKQSNRPRRQTLVFSATLTLPGMTNANDILTLAHAQGETKTIDLSNQHSVIVVAGTTTTATTSTTTRQPPPGPLAQHSTTDATVSKVQLPTGLTLQSIACIQRHKDSHLYAFLMTRRPQHGTTTSTSSTGSGCSTLVFCNSIAGVRRVHLLLQTLHLNAKPLHANMTQVRNTTIMGVDGCMCMQVCVFVVLSARLFLQGRAGT